MWDNMECLATDGRIAMIDVVGAADRAGKRDVGSPLWPCMSVVHAQGQLDCLIWKDGVAIDKRKIMCLWC